MATAPTHHRVIALISGGKDSLFSILHCIRAGHEVVALANLHPAPAPGQAATDEGPDLESFMFQTVGHSIVPLYAEALQLPLFRRAIVGGAVNTDREYAVPTVAQKEDEEEKEGEKEGEQKPGAGNQDQDETESLLHLLRHILSTHPTATAISTGAILSTYQRTRVESVCTRLGLVSLAPLWQYPSLPPHTPTSLLADMRQVRQDARIIKVASAGLDASFLWADVASPRCVARVRRALARFGDVADGAVLGEGGEFETCAVDGPGELWRGGRIDVSIAEEGVVGEGGSAAVKFLGARVVPREECEEGKEAGKLADLRVPDLLDTEFDALLRTLLDLPLSSSSDETEAETADTDTQTGEAAATAMYQLSLTPTPLATLLRAHTSPSHYTDPSRLSISGSTLYITNLTAPAYDTAPQQLASLTRRLSALLDAFGLTPAALAHCTLLLRRMADFAACNAVYAQLFGAPLPPSRVTVACGEVLGEGVLVALSAVAVLEEECEESEHMGAKRQKQGLHVQSRSYWAPANIGPYSQAISVPTITSSSTSSSTSPAEIVYIAGQIPLVPWTMALPNLTHLPSSIALPTPTSTSADAAPFALATTLALQHLIRIARATAVSAFPYVIAYITAASPTEAARRARIAREAWHGMLASSHAAYTAEVEAAETDDDVDVWDLKNRGWGSAAGAGAGAEERDPRARVPAWEHVRVDAAEGGGEGEGKQEMAFPPCIVVQVASLPRDAGIEWAAPGLKLSSDPKAAEIVHSSHRCLHKRGAADGVADTNANVSGIAINTGSGSRASGPLGAKADDGVVIHATKAAGVSYLAAGVVGRRGLDLGALMGSADSGAESATVPAPAPAPASKDKEGTEDKEGENGDKERVDKESDNKEGDDKECKDKEGETNEEDELTAPQTTLYVSTSFATDATTELLDSMWVRATRPALVPCLRVWGSGGEEVGVGVVGVRVG